MSVWTFRRSTMWLWPARITQIRYWIKSCEFYQRRMWTMCRKGESDIYILHYRWKPQVFYSFIEFLCTPVKGILSLSVTLWSVAQSRTSVRWPCSSSWRCAYYRSLRWWESDVRGSKEMPGSTNTWWKTYCPPPVSDCATTSLPVSRERRCRTSHVSLRLISDHFFVPFFICID